MIVTCRAGHSMGDAYVPADGRPRCRTCRLERRKESKSRITLEISELSEAEIAKRIGFGRLIRFITPSDECWIWRGDLSGSGYGRLWVGSRYFAAHRISFLVFRGPIAPGLVLDHLCRRRSCVNPSHLDPVTNRTNILRGEGVCARNSRKTHCIRGHPLSKGNVRKESGNRRRCLSCGAAKSFDAVGARGVWQLVRGGTIV